MTDKAIVLDTPEQIEHFRLSTLKIYARSRATGLHLTSKSKVPSIRSWREQYPELLGKCRTWNDIADAIEEYFEHIKNDPA